MSIENTLLPYLSERLHTTGWALVNIEPSPKIETDLLVIASLAGRILGNSFGYHILDAMGSIDTLALHTEGISNEDGVIPYFSLGCITPSTVGGETRIYDGRMAAKLIDDTPSLSDILIEYSALAHPQSKICYPLVVPEYGRTVRYRSRVETNTVIHSGDFSIDDMYHQIDEIIRKCLIVSHQWVVGDLLFVNNLFTLHDRLPFVGHRRMLRVRYNDTLNTRIRY